MFKRPVWIISREFNKDPQSAIRHAHERLANVAGLKPTQQIELVDIFARGSSHEMVEAVDAAATILQAIGNIDRNSKILAPLLYPVLLNVVGHGSANNMWVSMQVIGQAIAGANLSTDEQSKLIDSVEQCKDLRARIWGARKALIGLSEVRTTDQNTDRLTNVIRAGLFSEDPNIRRFSLESILEVLQKSPMRDDKGKTLQSLARDCAAAIRSEMVSVALLDEDSRAFLARLSAFATDGPVPLVKPEKITCLTID